MSFAAVRGDAARLGRMQMNFVLDAGEATRDAKGEVAVRSSVAHGDPAHARLVGLPRRHGLATTVGAATLRAVEDALDMTGLDLRTP